jgi:hypothetical protein
MDPLAAVEKQDQPFAKLLGIRYVSASPERVTAEIVVRDDLCTIPAVAHGGVLMAFADTLGAVATILNLPPGLRPRPWNPRPTSSPRRRLVPRSPASACHSTAGNGLRPGKLA